MAVVAVMVLIAVLFLGGAGMALAVSSNLHTEDIITAQDAVHYAAESAVARGIAAGDQCSPGGSLTVGSDMINLQSWAFWCNGTDESGGEHPATNQTVDLGRWAVAGQQLGTCASISLPLAVAKATAWTVVGWRGAGQLQVWIDTNESCSSRVGADCHQETVTANVSYIRCRVGSGNPFLHLDGGNLYIGSSIIRWAPTGSGAIRTVVGVSGFEVDEADALGSKEVLWNTVLP
jgi:hypothetical protein